MSNCSKYCKEYIDESKPRIALIKQVINDIEYNFPNLKNKDEKDLKNLENNIQEYEALLQKIYLLRDLKKTKKTLTKISI